VPLSNPPTGFTHEPIRLRFVGALLGAFAGDALGMPVIGLGPRAIGSRHGRVEDLLEGPLMTGSYTDATDMTRALAESLLARRGLDVEHAAKHLAAVADLRRGYGTSTRETLEDIGAGVHWRTAASRRFSHGSFGNGAASRVAPVGLLAHRDLDSCADLARMSSDPTHMHPLGRGGAVMQALGVAAALRWGAEQPSGMEAVRFLGRIEEHLLDQECLYRECLEKVAMMLERHPSLPLDAGVIEWVERAEAVAAVLGNDSRAFESIPAALYAFLAQRGSLEETVVAAVSLGGDTAAIAAMAGALAGAHLGVEAIPQRWLDGLEGGALGRDYIAGLADDLFLLWLEVHADDPLVPAAL
jgi:ADP-ribosylglycohydrolase